MESSPTITDWIQTAVMFLTLPTIIYGIIKVFRRDRQREDEINSLRVIATNQVSINEKMQGELNEFMKQTQVFEYQSSLLRESNDLLREQVKLQTDTLLNDKDFKKNLFNLENSKRKSSIRPYFICHSCSTSGTTLGVKLINLGPRAHNIAFKEIQTANIVVTSPSTPNVVIEKDQELQLSGHTKNGDEASQTFWELELSFDDEDKNRYHQRLKGIGHDCTITQPAEQNQIN